jgi:hypothetical protein
MMNRIVLHFGLSILLCGALQAEIIGIDDFNYNNGDIAGQAGGQYWDWDNTTQIHTGTVSNWNNVFGSAVVQNNALLVNSGGALREYNGPTEGSAEGTDERLGAFREAGVVYYGVTVTQLTENSWCGFSSFDFGSERIFFGQPSQGSAPRYFGIQISGGGATSFSSIAVVVGQTYRLVSALDFDGDQLRMWIDPDMNDYDNGTADNTADVTLAYTGSNWSSSIRLAGGGQSRWDDLIVANSFADILGPRVMNPYPADGAVGIEVDTALSWQLTQSPSQVTYNVYFGTDQSAVMNGDSSVFAGNQSSQSFTPALLQEGACYYWRVDVVDSEGIYPGRVLRFCTVLPSFDCLALDTDLNADCVTDIRDFLYIAEQWMGMCAGQYCGDIDKANGIDFQDFALLAEEWEKQGPVVVINEFLASNSDGLTDEDGDESDWIELKNLSDEVVDLNGWYLTDEQSNLLKWQLPDISLEARGFLLVFASEKDRSGPAAQLHTNFQLSKEGEYLALVRPDGSICHEFTPRFPSQTSDISYGLTYIEGFDRYQYGYFDSPTPRSENGQGRIGIVEDKVNFSIEGGIFTGAFQLTLDVDNPNADIYYTVDDTEPTIHSTRYSNPISITTTSAVRARAIEPGKISGPVSGEYYVFLASSVQDFNSDLPLLVIDNFGKGALGDNDATTPHLFKSSVVGIFSPQLDGRSRLADTPEILTRAGAKVRGVSSSTFAKKGYAIEFWDEHNQDKSLPVLDMPADSDWVLYAPYYFDRAMIRNSLIFALSNQTGRYAPRTRFVEVFLNTDGGALNAGDYIGVYVLMEKIKRGEERVAVEKLDTTNNAEPEIAGGYIFKNDWLESGEIGWYTAMGKPASQGGGGYLNSALSLAYPEQEDITTEQFTYLKNYFQGFENAVYNLSGEHYSQYIDVDSWVDHNILNMFAKNVDALRLSAYFHKSREGRIQAGPLWDFDRSMDSYDGRDDDPYTWKGTGDGTDYFNYEWWNRLFMDSDFRLRYADRWFAMRRGALRTENIDSIIDSMASELQEAQSRNYIRWPDVAPSVSWNYEINHLKDWLARRAEWIDAQMTVEFASVPPIFSHEGGYVDSGTELSITSSGSQILVEKELIAPAAPVRVYVPTNNALGLTWTAKAFVPGSGWTDGSTKTGVGYERTSGYQSIIQTDVESSMYGISTSVFCRLEFAHDGSTIETLTLRMKYDDAFIAYLNGTEIYRTSNITNATPGSATASPDHEASATVYDVFDISAYRHLVVPGTNVLAIHGINSGSTSSDMLIYPCLDAAVWKAGNSLPVWYTVNGSDPRLPGGSINPSAIQYFQPLLLTNTVQIKARVFVNGDWSALNEAVFAVGPVLENLRITEIMYHPVLPEAEFIELKNIGTESINLNLVTFSKGIGFSFAPAAVLGPGEYTVLVQNMAAFMTAYPDFTGTIAGVYSGSLDNAGERIELIDAMGSVIHNFSYKDSWYDITDGKGFSLTVRNAAQTDLSLWDKKSGWRPSTAAGGSPGNEDSGIIPPLGAIVINELLAHSDTDQYDWIELYNTTSEDINLGGWFLSDSNDDDAGRKKYQIPEGTIIKANGFCVFYENATFGNSSAPGCNVPFQFSENGETVYLQSGQEGVLTGYLVEEEFGASEPDVAFGRYYKSTGSYNFVAMSTNTPGYNIPPYVNAYPKVGPIVITEIMYHPQTNADAEYVELQNISNASVTLYDWITHEPWRFVDNADSPGLEFYFPSNTPVTMTPGQKILLVKNAGEFKKEFGQSSLDGITYYEWLSGSLSNSSEKPELQMPGDVDDSLVRCYIRIDRVSYEDTTPWPLEPDGAGYSLTKKPDSLTLYGNDVINWQSATPTPGL